MNGFYGKLLRINLTEQTVHEESIPEEVLRQYLGGKGLSAYYLYQELPARLDPYSPDNKLMFATGPVADTTFPAASRYGVYAKSPLTGLFGESYAGGHTAPAMKRTGFDAFIIEGAASKPVYLHISDRGVEFEDASDLWGKDTYSTEDALLHKVNVKGAQAVVIGVAGENLVNYACIKNNYWRTAGRTGMGAVMGSKKLKGVVFSGSQKAPLADEEMLQNYVKEFNQTHRDTPRTKNMQKRGTPYMVTATNQAHAFPTRYWAEGSFDKWQSISSDSMLERMEVKPKACARCFLACGKLSKVTRGRHQGLVLEGPEYETLYALGGICCIDQIEEVVYLNDLCDRLGVDTITGGNMAAFAIEAGKRGKLEGMPGYGDAEGIARLIEQIARKEGPGELLSRGIKPAARELGLEELAVHVKGMEPAGYDPRALPGMSLGYAVSNRGACHLRSSFYMGELRGDIPREMVEGKARLFLNYENTNAIQDSMIMCRFYGPFMDWDDYHTIIKATTGMDLYKDDFYAMAGRVTTLTRRFNLREGMTKEDDTIPARFFHEPVGPDKNLVNREEDLETMIQEYYQLHGWDENGIPGDEPLL